MSEDAKAARARRLAVALRANLQRRKVAASRSPAPETGPSACGSAPKPRKLFEERAIFDRSDKPARLLDPDDKGESALRDKDTR